MLENERGDAARVGPQGAASGFVAALVALAFLWALSRAAPRSPSRRWRWPSGSFAWHSSLIGRFLFGRAGPEAAGLLVLPDRPPALPSRAVFPAIPGLSPELTAPADHYVVDIDIEDPVVDVGKWTLEVTGLVDEPLSLTLDALQRDFELVEEVSVLTCVSNPVGGPLVGSSRWTGVRLGDVLRRSQPRPTSVEVVLRCADGYDVSVPLARALESSALLAIGHEGRLLRQEHGFP